MTDITENGFEPSESRKIPMVKSPEPKRAEYVFSIIIFALSFCFVRFTIFNISGFITTGVYILIITSAMVFLKISGCKFSWLCRLTAVMLYLFSLVYSLTDDVLIKFMDTFFLWEQVHILFTLRRQETRRSKGFFLLHCSKQCLSILFRI